MNEANNTFPSFSSNMTATWHCGNNKVQNALPVFSSSSEPSCRFPLFHPLTTTFLGLHYHEVALSGLSLRQSNNNRGDSLRYCGGCWVEDRASSSRIHSLVSDCAFELTVWTLFDLQKLFHPGFCGRLNRAGVARLWSPPTLEGKHLALDHFS